MSTTFGILKPGLLMSDELEKEDKFIEVAFRYGDLSCKNRVSIRFTNELASLLPDETPVWPIDNSAQGVYTIGDLKALME